MNSVLAEISDKMPPVDLYWMVGTFLAICAYGATRAYRPLAAMGVAAGLLILISCASELTMDGWGTAVRKEMGLFYLVSMAGAIGSLTLTGALVALVVPPRAPTSHPHCNCGYDLTGNTSGVCPECGTAVKAEAPPPA